MITIRFPDDASKRRAIGFLVGRYSFKSKDTGEMLVPAAALTALALEGITYNVEGPATYGQAVPALRDAAAAEVQ